MPPIVTTLGRTPQRPLSKALGMAPAVNLDHGIHAYPENGVSDGAGAFAVSPPLMRDTIARHWSVSSRRLHPEDRNPQGSDGVPRVPRASRRQPPDRGPKTSTDRSKGVSRLWTAGSGRNTRRPPPKRRPADDTPVNASLSTRGSSRRRRCPPRSPKAPRHPPPALVAAAAHRTLQRLPAADRRRSHATTDPRPRGAKTRCRHRIHATWFKRTSGCPPRHRGRRHTTHTAQHRRGVPRHGAVELRPKPQPSHVAPWNVRQRDSAQTQCS